MSTPILCNIGLLHCLSWKVSSHPQYFPQCTIIPNHKPFGSFSCCETFTLSNRWPIIFQICDHRSNYISTLPCWTLCHPAQAVNIISWIHQQTRILLSPWIMNDGLRVRECYPESFMARLLWFDACVVYLAWRGCGAVHWKCLLPRLPSCCSVFSLRESSEGPAMHKSALLLYTSLT